MTTEDEASKPGEGQEPDDRKNESPPQQFTASEMELTALRRDAADYKDKYWRLLAEMENTKKRLQKERHELTQYSVQNIIIDFLPPIDHMEMRSSLRSRCLKT